MDNYLDTLKDKSIAVIGAGKTGFSGVKYLFDKVKNIKLFDDNKISDDVINFLNSNSIKFSNLNNEILAFDMIFLSPGVPRSLEIIQKAIENKIEIVNDIELLHRIKPDVKTVAITGSNGKTTTTYLTGEIFSKKYKTAIAGNIGTPVLDLIDDDYEVFILELSSFQIESLTKFSPNIATILNITPDHLDRYESMNEYAETKKIICKNVENTGTIILNREDILLKDLIYDNTLYFSSKLTDSDIYIENNKIVFNKFSINLSEIFVKGVHNYENIMSAILMANAFDISFEIIKDTVINFSGVEHRLEFIKKIDGVSYYNDSKATNPDSVVSAINSFDTPIIWLAGGRSKKTPFNEVLKLVKTKVKYAIFFGESKEEFADTFKNIIDFDITETLESAILKAKEISKNGDIIVLSPGCTSFDAYTSYEKRGKHFKELVGGFVEN